MGYKNIIFKLLNFVFWTVALSIIFIILYNVFESSVIKLLKDKHSINSENIINELAECTSIYLGTIKNNQYVKANNINVFLNRKANHEYDNIKEKLEKTSDYKVILKEIYKLSDETYRCYFLIKDKKDDNISYLNKMNKDEMDGVIVLKLNTKDSTFNVLFDTYR